MTIRAIILDIGGVLEITPDPQMVRLIERWVKRLHFKPGELAERLASLDSGGALGTCTEEEWLHDLRAATGMNQADCDEFMSDFWVEYLGELNVESISSVPLMGGRPASSYSPKALRYSFFGHFPAVKTNRNDRTKTWIYFSKITIGITRRFCLFFATNL